MDAFTVHVMVLVGIQSRSVDGIVETLFSTTAGRGSVAKEETNSKALRKKETAHVGQTPPTTLPRKSKSLSLQYRTMRQSILVLIAGLFLEV